MVDRSPTVVPVAAAILQPPPVADRARELGIELIQTDDASLSPPDADAGVVVAFGQLVREPLLLAFPLVQPPSVAPSPVAGRRAVERAILAGDGTPACA